MLYTIKNNLWEAEKRRLAKKVFYISASNLRQIIDAHIPAGFALRIREFLDTLSEDQTISVSIPQIQMAKTKPYQIIIKMLIDDKIFVDIAAATGYRGFAHDLARAIEEGIINDIVMAVQELSPHSGE